MRRRLQILAIEAAIADFPTPGSPDSQKKHGEPNEIIVDPLYDEP